MFGYLQMACKESDCTFVMTAVRRLKHTILVLKLTLVVVLWLFLSSDQPSPLFTFVGNIACRVQVVGPQRFWPHRRDCLHVVMLICQTHLVVKLWVPPLLTRLQWHGHNALIEMSHKIAAYNYTGRACFGLPRYPKHQRKTCCQEYDCKTVLPVNLPHNW